MHCKLIFPDVFVSLSDESVVSYCSIHKEHDFVENEEIPD